MIPAIIIVALLALAGFLFWLANRYDSMPTGFFAGASFAAAIYFVSEMLS